MVLGAILQGNVALIFSMLAFLYCLNKVNIYEYRLQCCWRLDVVLFVKLRRMLLEIWGRAHYLNQMPGRCRRPSAIIMDCHVVDLENK